MLRSVLLFADRLGVHDDGWSVAPFLGRLEGQGLDPQVLCVEAAGDAAADHRVVGCPGLGNALADAPGRAEPPVRRAPEPARPAPRPPRPARRGHARDRRALEIPYVLTVDGFFRPTAGSG